MIFIFKWVMGSMLIFTGAVCLFRGPPWCKFLFHESSLGESSAKLGLRFWLIS